MAMVQLPHALPVTDVAGVPGSGVRGVLRDRWDIEAAIGSFPVQTPARAESSSPAVEVEMQGFVRLSHAVYNRPEEFELLRDAVLELTAEATKA